MAWPVLLGAVQFLETWRDRFHSVPHFFRATLLLKIGRTREALGISKAYGLSRVSRLATHMVQGLKRVATEGWVTSSILIPTPINGWQFLKFNGAQGFGGDSNSAAFGTAAAGPRTCSHFIRVCFKRTGNGRAAAQPYLFESPVGLGSRLIFNQLQKKRLDSITPLIR